MNTACEKLQVDLEYEIRRVQTNARAVGVMSRYDVQTPEGWSLYVGCNSLYTDHKIRVVLHYSSGDSSWHEIAREIARLRREYGVPKLSREVNTYDASVSNTYQGSVETGWGELSLHISTGDTLPPRCTVETVAVKRRKTVTEYTTKVVCS